jgi:type II secretory pathway pseudopilin PulG
MIELIIVILLFAILAAFIAPRVLRMDQRRAANEASQVARILGVAARRASLSSEVVAVDFDTDTLTVLTLRRVQARGRAARTEWVEDPLIEPVNLAATQVRRAFADGTALRPDRWRVEFPAAEPRPMLSLVLAPPRQPESAGWQIELLPDDMNAIKSSAGATSRSAQNAWRHIDLDAQNRGEKAW